MLRLIIFSDSHRDFHAIYRIVKRHPDADLYLHLGDGEREFDDLACCFPELAMKMVRGNNDLDSTAPTILLEEAAGKRILITHGHLHSVKSGLSRLLLDARRMEADIVLYGHTHTAFTDVKNSIHIMNPGSVSLPCSGPATYGMIDIDGDAITMHILPVEEGR